MKDRLDHVMWNKLFKLSIQSGKSLQGQLRGQLVCAILDGHVPFGHHDSLITRLSQSYRQRWQIMGDALKQYLPETSRMPAFGGTSVWIEGPSSLDCSELYGAALEKVS